MSSTGGSAGAIGATVAGIASTTVTGAVSIGAVGAGWGGADAIRTGAGFPVGKTMVPSGDGNWLTAVVGIVVVAVGAEAPRGARAAGALAIPEVVVAVGSSAADCARSAAPKAAVMPNMAVVDRPVERMRADRAT